MKSEDLSEVQRTLCKAADELRANSAIQELSIYGQEQKDVTVPLAKMNLDLHGLSGDIRLAGSYYDNLHDAVGRFDFVMANPPFNVNGIDKEKLAGDNASPSVGPRAGAPPTRRCHGVQGSARGPLTPCA